MHSPVLTTQQFETFTGAAGAEAKFESSATQPLNGAKQARKEKELLRMLSKQDAMLKQAMTAIKRMNQQVSMILTLVNDMLDLAKIEQFKFTLHEDYFDLSQLIKSVS